MLKKIKLTNFRNFKSYELSLSRDTSVIVGANATGKTNLLEAIYLLSTGKSFKARVEEEMINYDEELSRIEGEASDSNKLEIVLTRGFIERGSMHEKTARKRLTVNGVGKRLVDFSSNFTTVIFRPQDMDLVTESPSTRRRFLDALLSQVDYEYRRSLLSYEKGLRRRNKLLWNIRENGVSRSHLYFWDKLLIKNGEYLQNKREEFVDYMNNYPQINEKKYAIEYDKSAISDSRLKQYASEEVSAATTLVGPHRDDMLFLMGRKIDLAKYGSRGEQRMAVLWVKMVELAFIREKNKSEATLLLDDIFSELDRAHRELVFEITRPQQTIITSADPHNIEGLAKQNKLEITQL
ncbi:DNA replication and repair protein RecF [Candidatus Microgenomates bacterium]|nr:MAG: DNA replication and repair protein RecF [Candidatus Microgenomates bacterium]